jgi:tetratricopeptide (TPR) repeat protein
MADAYSLLGFYGIIRPAEVMPLARAAASRALDLDSTLAEAHTALGWVNMMYYWDMDAAGTQFRRAIELNPSYVPGHYRLAEYLFHIVRQDDQAVAAARRAVELDPLSSHALHILAIMLAGIGEHAEAIAHRRRVIDLAPTYFLNYQELARIYAAQARYPEAFAVLDTALALGRRHPMIVASYGQLLIDSGDSTGAAALYDELVTRRREEYVPPSYLGALCFLLGRANEAWEWFERAIEERDQMLIVLHRLAADLGLSELTDDSRWDAFRRQVGLPERE